MFSTISLYAEQNGLGNILQQAGEKKTLVKPIPKKKITKKQTRFIFTDEYDSNGIGLKDRSNAEKKSESYDYDNKSEFKFKFNDGSQYSNIVGRQGATGMGGTGGSGSGGGRR